MTQVIDGGLSTELERLGAHFDGPLWTGRTLLEHPELIEEAHRNFIDAGAHVIITSSYQLSRQGFVAIGLSEDDADRALRRSVEIARSAASGTSVKVAASIGPFGAILHDGSEYRGKYGRSQVELAHFHAERLAVLLEADPDILLAETIPDLDELTALVTVLSEVDRPVWISLTSSDGIHIGSGQAIEEAIELIGTIPQLEALGFNCVDPALVSGLVDRARSVSDFPLVIYPNRGGRWDASTSGWESPEGKELAAWWDQWADLGIRYIGGCCGNDAPAISRLSSRVTRPS